MVRDYSKADIIKMIYKEAEAQGVDPDIIVSIVEQESGFNPKAVSPKNSNGSRDHGLMQLNDKYHKLKNPYDPMTNLRYGIKHFKGLLTGAKGDVRKALSNYNAGAGATGKGRQQGNKYADKVLSIYDKYVGNNTTDKGKVTGGASNMSAQGGFINPQRTPTRPVVTRDDLVNAMTQMGQNNLTRAMETEALGGTQQQRAITNILNQYNAGAIPYFDAVKLLTYYGYPKEALERLPVIDQEAGTTGRLQQLQSVAGTPEEQAVSRQDYLNAIQQIQANQNQGRNMYDMLNQAYDQYRQDIQMPTGYSVDPSGLAAQALGSAGLANLGADPKNYMGYTDLRNAAYQAQVANQAGVPYDVYMKMREEQLALDKQRIVDMLTAQGVIAPTDQEALKQIANLSKEETERMKELITQAGGILKQREANVGNLQQEGLKTQGSIATTGMTQAGSMYGKMMDYISKRWDNMSEIEKERFSQELQLTKQEMENEVKAYTADQNRAARENVAQTQKEAQQYTADTKKEIAAEDRPIKKLQAVGQYSVNTAPVQGYNTRTPEQRLTFDAATLPDDTYNLLRGDVQLPQPPQPQQQPQAFNLFGLFGGNR